MTKKIMFFDIDGTILSETTNTIPESTVLGLQKAKENGHLVFINTGRPFASVDQIIKDLNPDGYVCGCGTYIRYHDEVLFSESIEQNRCLEIRDLARSTNADVILEGKNTVYFDEVVTHPNLAAIKTHYLAEPTINTSTFDDPNLTFDKFAAWFNADSNMEAFRNSVKDDFDIIERANDFLEIVPKGHSKATGIQFLLDYFNMKLDDAYVFGDSLNDKPMLEYVNHAIVMGNGKPELFDLAYYVTKDIEEDGIYHALEYLNLI